MSTICIVLVTYAFFPKQLFDSTMNTRHDIRWYIFFHGHDVNVLHELQQFAGTTNTLFHPYGINRGLARSWNDGLRLFVRERGDILLFVNDDVLFYNNAFDEYVDFIISTKRNIPDFGQISVFGLETGTAEALGSGDTLGKPAYQGLACSAIGENAIEKIGYFDQNFWPVYFTDTDYMHRIDIACLPRPTDTRTLLEHNRSLTTRIDPSLRKLHDERFKRGQEYYLRKWGGLPLAETFASPFADPRFDFFISSARTGAPYGPDYDRHDLATAGTIGVMQGE